MSFNFAMAGWQGRVANFYVAMWETYDMNLFINTKAMDTIKCHAEDTFPNECCGILVGTCAGGCPIVAQQGRGPDRRHCGAGTSSVPHPSQGAKDGAPSADSTAKLGSIIPAENVATSDRRVSYQIDWKTLFSTIRSVRSTSHQVLGFYHSHPDGSTEPSRRDRETAWIGYIYVILPVVEGLCGDTTAWRIEQENARFERVTIDTGVEHT